jgi:hypothetical protein
MCNRFFLVLLVFPFVLFAQPCIVASGQTVAFTLSAGAKASWNNPIVGIRQGRSVSKNGTSFSVYQLSNGTVAFKNLGFKYDVPLEIYQEWQNKRRIRQKICTWDLLRPSRC